MRNNSKRLRALFYKLLHIMTNLYSGNLWKHEKGSCFLSFFYFFRCFAIKSEGCPQEFSSQGSRQQFFGKNA